MPPSPEIMCRSPLTRSVLSGPGRLGGLREHPGGLRDEERRSTASTRCLRVMPRTIASHGRDASAGKIAAPHEQTRPPSSVTPPAPSRAPRPFRRSTTLASGCSRRLHAGDVPGVLAELFLAAGRPAVAAPPRARPGDVAVARPAHRAGVADARRATGRCIAGSGCSRTRSCPSSWSSRALRALHAAGGAARSAAYGLFFLALVTDDAGGVRGAVRAGDGSTESSPRCTPGSWSPRCFRSSRP